MNGICRSYGGGSRRGDFVREAGKAGYQIASVNDHWPWRVITPEGKSLDLVRQLETARTKDVRSVCSRSWTIFRPKQPLCRPLEIQNGQTKA